MTAHTPTPWTVAGDWIKSTDGTRVADFCLGSGHETEAEANTAFAVRAVNCHDELLEACQAAFAELANDPKWNVSFLRLDVLRAAIAKATGNPA